MKTAMRIIVTFFAFLATHYFIYWVPFSIIPGARTIAYLPNIVSFLLAFTVAVFVWKKTGTSSLGLASHIVLGGIILGALGFIAGFFGPLIFNKGGNQGPLLGIFITGPIGFFSGLIAGGLYWKIKKNKQVSKPENA